MTDELDKVEKINTTNTKVEKTESITASEQNLQHAEAVASNTDQFHSMAPLPALGANHRNLFK